MTQLINWKALTPFTESPFQLPDEIPGLGKVRLMRFESKPYAVVLIAHSLDGIAESAARRQAYVTLGKLKERGLASILTVCDGSTGQYVVYVGTPLVARDTSRSVLARLCACANLKEPTAFEEALREHLLEALEAFAEPFGVDGYVASETPGLFARIRQHAVSLEARIRSVPNFGEADSRTQQTADAQSEDL